MPAYSRILLPWDSQPQEVEELSGWATSQGFRYAIAPGVSRFGSGLRLAITGGAGTPTNSANSTGRTRVYSSSSDYIQDGGALDPRNGYVWVWVGSWSALGNYSGLVARTSDNSTTSGWAWQRFSTADSLYVYHGATNASLSTIDDLLSSESAVWVGGWDATSNALSLYRNGTLVRSGTLATAPVYTAGVGQLKLAASRDQNTTSAVCSLAAFAIGTSPTQALASALYENPWRLFADRTIWVPVSAGGGGVTGTLATTNANDTSSAAGTTTVVGTLAKTNANDTSSASGTTTVTGTLATTNANDTSAASGSVGGDVTGTVAYTNANDTSAASGTTTVTGTVAYTNANDSATASGWAGAVSGTVAVTNANDTASAIGAAASDQASGGWFPMPRRRTKKEIDDERRELGILPPEVVAAAAAIPKPQRQKITMAQLVGKTTAKEVSRFDLEAAITAHKRKRQRMEDELLLLM